MPSSGYWALYCIYILVMGIEIMVVMVVVVVEEAVVKDWCCTLKQSLGILILKQSLGTQNLGIPKKLKFMQNWITLEFIVIEALGNFSKINQNM